MKNKLSNYLPKVASANWNFDSKVAKRTRIAPLQKQSIEYSMAVTELNSLFADLGHQLADAELSIAALKRKVVVLSDENRKLQEESTALRTRLISVKNSNVVLSEGLERAVSKAETCKKRIMELEPQKWR